MVDQFIILSTRQSPTTIKLRTTGTTDVASPVKMRFHATSSMSDGCNSKSELTFAVTNISCEANGDRDDHGIGHGRITCHPSEALEESVKEQGFVPANCPKPAEDLEVTKSATKQLERPSLRDGAANVYQPTEHSLDSSSHSVLSIPSHSQRESAEILHPISPCSVALEQRSSSPPPSVLSSRVSATTTTTGFRSPRERFLIFIKILFKRLDQGSEPPVQQRAKKIVAECTRRNRLRDPQFSPLMEAVEKRLRRFVGEMHWRRAMLLLRHFIANQMETAARLLPKDIQIGEP